MTVAATVRRKCLDPKDESQWDHHAHYVIKTGADIKDHVQDKAHKDKVYKLSAVQEHGFLNTYIACITPVYMYDNIIKTKCMK